MGEHTCVADGVIAHNFTVLRRTRSLLHDLVDVFLARRPRLKRDPSVQPRSNLV
jgi:hypothetical protein